jgi:hypothetical protein
LLQKETAQRGQRATCPKPRLKQVEAGVVINPRDSSRRAGNGGLLLGSGGRKKK